MADADEQLLITLEKVEKLCRNSIKLNKKLSDGFFGLSEARFGSRWNKINQYSFPARFEPSVKVLLVPQAGTKRLVWTLVKEHEGSSTEQAPIETFIDEQKSEETESTLRHRRKDGNKRSSTRNVRTDIACNGVKSPVKNAKTKTPGSNEGGHNIASNAPKSRTIARRNPLNWFGLPPPALQRAQNAFAESIALVPLQANLAHDTMEASAAFADFSDNEHRKK